MTVLYAPKLKLKCCKKEEEFICPGGDFCTANCPSVLVGSASFRITYLQPGSTCDGTFDDCPGPTHSWSQNVAMPSNHSSGSCKWNGQDSSYVETHVCANGTTHDFKPVMTLNAQCVTDPGSSDYGFWRYDLTLAGNLRIIIDSCDSINSGCGVPANHQEFVPIASSCPGASFGGAVLCEASQAKIEVLSWSVVP